MENVDFFSTTWFARIYFCTLTIITTGVLYKEYVKLKQHCRCLLNLFYLATIASSVICTILHLTTYFDIICTFTLPLLSTFGSIQKVLLTCYQIAKLQSTFSRSALGKMEDVFNKYGFSSYTFGFLYINGIMFVVYLCVLELSILPKPMELGYFGCKNMLFDKSQILILMSTSLWYYGWDWSVLIMYVLRLIKIKRDMKLIISQKFTKRHVYLRIKQILQKIVILTVLYELTILFLLITVGLTDVSRYNYIGITATGLNIIIPVFVIYLMIQHNEEQYSRIFVNTLGSILICSNEEKQNNGIPDDNKNGDIESTTTKCWIFF